MKKRYLVFFAIAIMLLATALTGCASKEESFEGKNIVTFQLNDGTLDYKTSSTRTEIYFAYDPGTYILDPTTIPNYKLYRNGYNFTGWYTDSACTKLWDFKTPFVTETLTLYAGWTVAINYSYTVCYVDGAEEIVLGTYPVSAGDKFEDWRGYAQNRKGYTALAYYSDAALSDAWDYNTSHPGGETDNDIKIYVQYVEGDWVLVDTFEKLKSTLKNGKNAYLTADIDGNGGELYVDKTYNGSLAGNGYSVSNITVPKKGTALNPACYLFLELGKDAVIKDVSFTDVTFNLLGVSDKVYGVKVAALAITSLGATVENVSVSGVLNTNHTGDVSKLNEAFFEGNEADSIEGFTSDITVNYN